AGDHFHHPSRLPLRGRSVDVSERVSINFILILPAFAQRFLRCSNVREFGIAVRTPNQVRLIYRAPQMQYRVAHCDFAHVLSHMGEEEFTGNIPRSVDVPLRRAAAPVDLDSTLTELHSRSFETQAIQAWFPAHRCEHRIAVNRFLVIERCSETLRPLVDPGG